MCWRQLALYKRQLTILNNKLGCAVAETFLRAAELIGVDPKDCVGWVPRRLRCCAGAAVLARVPVCISPCV